MLFLYPPGTTDFNSVQSSPLTDAFDDVMIEELNGRYDLSFNYPVDKLEELDYEFKDFSIIMADSPRLGRQPFFITEIEKKDEHIHVEAKHVFFLLDIFNMDYVDCSGDPNFVLEVVDKAIIDRKKFPLKLYSNILQRVDLETTTKTCMMDTLCKGKDSLLSQVRGELLRNGYNVGFVNGIGKETDYILAQRKNIEDISIKLDYTKIVTKIHTEMTIDRKKFIPEKIPGSSKVYNINSVPESDRTSYRIRILDGARGGKITENAGAFMLFDANGHFVLSNSQTGTPASIDMWKKRKEDLEKKIADYDSKKSDSKQKKVNDYTKKVQVSEKELKQNTATYNRTKKESDRKRVESSKRTLRQNKEILERAKKDLAKIGNDLVKWKKELSEIPTVILGERYYNALLPPGEYFSVMKSAPNGYIHNQDVHHFTIGYGGGEYVDDWYVNPETYEEDQTFRLYASVDSPIIGAYPYTFHSYEELKDSDDKFDVHNLAVWSTSQPWVLDEEATIRNMEKWAEEIFEGERPDLPLETLSFSLGDEVLESGLGLGDSATVVYENYGLYKNHPLVTIEWSPMQLKYLKMEFGDKPGSFTADLQSQLNSGLSGLQKQFDSYRDRTSDDISRRIETEGDRLRSMGIETLNMANLDSYFRTEEVKRGLLEFIEQKGADNVSAMEIEILASQLYVEELEDKYGTPQELRSEMEAMIEQSRQQALEQLQQIEAKQTELDNTFKNFKELAESDKEKIISQFTELKNENTQKIAQLTGDIDGFTQTIASIDRKVENNYTTVVEKINNVQQTTDGYKTTMASIERRVNNVTGEVETVQSHIRDIQQDTKGMSDTISVLNEGFTNLKRDNKSLSSTVVNLKTNTMSTIRQTAESMLLTIGTFKSLEDGKDMTQAEVDQYVKDLKEKYHYMTDEQIQEELYKMSSSGVFYIQDALNVKIKQLNLQGVVRFSDLNNPNSETVIDGNLIRTGKIAGYSRGNYTNYWNLNSGEFKNSYKSSDVVINDGKIYNDGSRYRTTIEDGRLILEDKWARSDYTKKLVLTSSMIRTRPYMSVKDYGGISETKGFGQYPSVTNDSGNIQIISFPVSIYLTESLKPGEWEYSWFSMPKMGGNLMDIRSINYIGITNMNFKECYVAFRDFDVSGNQITYVNVALTPATNQAIDARGEFTVTCLIICNGN